MQGSYNNSVICKWNITAISPCHSTAFLIIRKDLHESQSPSSQNCPIKDHVQLQYSRDQVDYYCGDSTANNCPISNCFPTLGITNSDGNTVVTFRSDLNGTAIGFQAVVFNNIEVEGCSLGLTSPSLNRVTTDDRITVPRNWRCQFLWKFFRYNSCDCTGTCTISRLQMMRDRGLLARVIRNIVHPDPIRARHNAYRYVNSPNNFLKKVARRVLKNIAEFGVAAPTIEQRSDALMEGATTTRTSSSLV